MAQQREEEIAQMVQMAWAHMDLGEYDEAQTIAQSLLEMEELAGYPLMAGIMALGEEASEAVALLKKGIATYPTSWELKLELGNLYGQLQETSVAMEVFDEALGMEGVEAHTIELYRGIAYLKGGEIEEALNTLQVIDHPDAINEAFSIQLEILDMLQRHDLIIEMAKEELEVLSLPESPEDVSTLANIFARIATAYWYEEEDNLDAIEHNLRAAIDLDRTNEQALWLSREREQAYAEEAHVYELLVQGVLVVDDEGKDNFYPFTAVYVVLEKSPQDALNRIKNYEMESIDKHSLEILEALSEPNEEEEPLGIYFVGELNFIDGEEAEA